MKCGRKNFTRENTYGYFRAAYFNWRIGLFPVWNEHHGKRAGDTVRQPVTGDSGKDDIEYGEGRTAGSGRYSDHSELFGHNRYGCWICQLWYHAAVTGRRGDHGSQYRNHGNRMDPEPDQYSGRQPDSADAEAIELYTDSGDDRRNPDHASDREAL